MSLNRSRQSLGGTNCLFEDAATQLRTDSAARDEIDIAAKKFLEPQFDAGEFDEARRMMKFNQQVDIAAWMSPASRDRAEQG
jgi:hypothetical protein